ncbi:glycosyltransferase [Enorma phocaeensis]|uniref:glycosyltransferase n=1 Tax=Enorma phocaeensis TaxID=1871019 RepID=UPI00320A90F2
MSLLDLLRFHKSTLFKDHIDPTVNQTNHSEDEAEYPSYYFDLDDVQRAIFRKPFGPDGFPIDAWADPYYENWFHEHKASEDELFRQAETWGSFNYQPLFSIIVPLYKTPLEYLHTMANSVLAQTYRNFQLILVNASPELPELAQEIQRYRENDTRITVITLERNLGITENTNRGLEVAKGDFCSFLDHDDFLEPDLLFEYVQALNEDPSIDVLYCDEDLVSFDTDRGTFRYLHPMFKPQYSPELLLCKNYIVHLMTIRRSVINDMPKPDNRYDGAQDYNMVLFCTTHGRKTHGIQKVLYHWRISDQSTAANPEAKPYSRQAYKLSAYNQLERNNLNGSIVASGLINIHNIWMNGPFPPVSLIVDCRSNENGLLTFLAYLKQNGLSEAAEVILLTDNEHVTKHSISNVIHQGNISICVVSSDSQATRLNSGAKRAQGEMLIFLDATCAFISPDPIKQLSALASIDGVGIASPKVLYRDGATKSYGIAVTSQGIISLQRGYPDDFPAYQCTARAFQNTSACSLQGLCIKRSVFNNIEGFCEEFYSEIAAVDLCRRVLNDGKRIVVTPTVKVEVNKPSPADPYSIDLEEQQYFSPEDLELLDKKWPGARSAGDPYLNSNLDQRSPFYQLTRP